MVFTKKEVAVGLLHLQEAWRRGVHELHQDASNAFPSSDYPPHYDLTVLPAFVINRHPSPSSPPLPRVCEERLQQTQRLTSARASPIPPQRYGKAQTGLAMAPYDEREESPTHDGILSNVAVAALCSYTHPTSQLPSAQGGNALHLLRLAIREQQPPQ